MPTTPRPGKKGLYIELPTDLDEQLRAYCEERGGKIAEEVRLAIRRHLANPPPLAELPPLPPVTAPAPVASVPAPTDAKKVKGKKAKT